MAPTLIQIAERIGIPRDKFEDLIQLEVVARAITIAADRPHFPPENVWKAVGRPVVLHKDGELDVELLEIELERQRGIITNAEGQVIKARIGHPLLMGRLQKAESIADRRLTVIYEALEALKHPTNPSRAQALLENEAERTQLRAEP